MVTTVKQKNSLNRPKTLRVFVDFVEGLKSLSKCHDKQVACIICDLDLKQIYSIGINGGPKKVKKYECLCDCEDTKYSCIHAEANALVKLRTGDTDKVMICSYSPCLQCASMIVNEPGGFSAVLFIEPHKDTVALQVLMDSGILVGQVSKDGGVTWLD